jgi:hypothetical protein
MNKNNLLGFFFLLVLTGCGSQFNLEKTSTLSFNESYYYKWTAGVKGGGSGLNIFLSLEETTNINLQIEGLYFKENYCKLKPQGSNKYQGFIKTNENQNSNILGDIVVVEENKTEKIPFTLDSENAVIIYKENGKRKYFKITLHKKQMQQFPM